MAPIDFPLAGIDDGVVRLRAYAEADLASVVAATRDPEITRRTRVPDDNSDATMREWLAEWRRRDAVGTELHLLVVDLDRDELLGAIGLNRLNDEGVCDLGYWIAREARGRGLAARAIRLFSGWIFAELPVERIEIHAEPDNHASCAAAERAGFRLEGVLRSHHDLKGTRVDVASYSMLRGELSGPSHGVSRGTHPGTESR